jgi:hypothetical protein
MPRDLVLFACPGLPESRVVRSYEEVLGPEVEIRWVALPGRSAVFTQAGQAARGKDGRCLPGLISRWAPGSWSSVSLVCFSAGYGLAREVLRHEDDRDELSGLVLLDALHAALGPTGLPMAAQLEPFVAYAELARGWRKLFVMGHTDVKTPQTGAGAFASTSQCAEALLARVGEPDGGLIVRAYDEADDAHQQREHGLALTGWGPSLVQVLGGWLEAWRAFHGAANGAEASADRGPETLKDGEPAPAWRDPGRPLGERAVAWSLAELAAGVHEEPPGSNTGPRIVEYLAPCERSGRPLGLTAGAWCAASACAAGRGALLPGEELPHAYRASGLELVADATERGTWRPKGHVPRVGDLAIYGRGPAGGWQRHVVRVLEVDGERWRSIGGNESDRWQVTERRLDDAALLGFIEYP